MAEEDDPESEVGQEMEVFLGPEEGQQPEKKPLTWENIPMKFKTDVALLLDVQSRHNFRESSFLNKEAADMVPVIFYNLKIVQKPKRFLRTPKLVFEKIDDRNGHKMFGRRNMKVDDAASQFSLIFKCKDSLMDILTFGGLIWSDEKPQNQKQIDKMLHKLVEAAKNRKETKNHKSEWKIRTLKWNCEIKDPIFAQFLGLFCKGFFENFEMKGQYFSKETLHKLCNIDSWKHLKVISIQPEIDCNGGILTSFYNTEKLEITVKEMDAKEIADFIKNWLSYKFPNGSYFSIHSNTPVEDFSGKVLEHFDPENKNEQFEYFSNDNKPYLEFKFPNDKKRSLSVSIKNHHVAGSIWPMVTEEELKRESRMRKEMCIRYYGQLLG